MSDPRTEEAAPGALDATTLIVDGIGAVKDLSAAVSAIDKTVNEELRREVNLSTEKATAIEGALKDLKSSVDRLAEIEAARLEADKAAKEAAAAAEEARRKNLQQIAVKLFDSKPVQYLLLAVVIIAAQVMAARYNVTAPSFNDAAPSAYQGAEDISTGATIP